MPKNPSSSSRVTKSLFPQNFGIR